MTNTETQKKIYGYTDFATAIRWLNNNYNEFSAALKYDKELKAVFDKKYNDGYTTPYLSDCSDDEVQYLKDTFDLTFEYSKVFEKWLLIVDHYGTQWDAVKWPVYSKSWWETKGQRHGFPKENIEKSKKYHVHFEVVGHIYQDIEADSIDEAYEKAKSSFAPEAGELENYQSTVVSITAPGTDEPTYFD